MMNLGKMLRKTLRIPEGTASPSSSTAPRPRRRSELDMYFTAQFHARAREWGLSEDHARYVFYEGETVKGKENMKVATIKGEEIGIYVFRDRDTNQPVITSIWKRQFRGTATSSRRR